MPTYEYRCPEGHEFERFYRKISDAGPEVSCPVCGKTAERQMSASTGFVLKGSGFYLTDYGKNAHRTSGPDAVGAADKGDAKGDDKGADKGSEKTDAKSEAAPRAEQAAPKSDSGSAPAKGDTKAGDSKPAPRKSSAPSSGSSKSEN